MAAIGKKYYLDKHGLVEPEDKIDDSTLTGLSKQEVLEDLDRQISPEPPVNDEIPADDAANDNNNYGALFENNVFPELPNHINNMQNFVQRVFGGNIFHPDHNDDNLIHFYKKKLNNDPKK